MFKLEEICKGVTVTHIPAVLGYEGAEIKRIKAESQVRVVWFDRKEQEVGGGFTGEVRIGGRQK